MTPTLDAGAEQFPKLLALLLNKAVQTAQLFFFTYFEKDINNLFTSRAVSGPTVFAISFINAVRWALSKIFTFFPRKYSAILYACCRFTEILNCLAYFNSSSPVIVLIL
jgi:hypothetical protein